MFAKPFNKENYHLMPIKCWANDVLVAFSIFNPLRPAPRSGEEKKSYATYFLSLSYEDKLVQI